MNQTSPSWNRLASFTALLFLTVSLPAQVKHFVLIGVDGLSPDGIQHAAAPHLKKLCQQGAWTFHARAVMPTSSSPNWASMIMGAGPEQHGITSNEWQTNKFEIAPTVRGPGGMFPTVYALLREQRPAAVIGVFHDWKDYGRLFERPLVNVIENPDGPTNTVRRAGEFIKQQRPTLTFIHLDHVDGAGHKFGHGTPAYYAAVDSADYLIGEFLTALEQAGMRSETLVLVTSDHGGVGKGHGGATMAEIEIPWILTGPGVRVGYEIQSPVNTYDTAATIAAVFQLKTPAAWIARPVATAFLGSPTQ